MKSIAQISDLERAVHIVHDVYLVDVIEQSGICPFARASREQGKVCRPIILDPQPEQALRAAISTVRDHAIAAREDKWEIMLLTFVGSRELAESSPRFEEFHRSFRLGLQAQELERLCYSVPFHPRITESAAEPDTPAKLVSYLRQSPDPVIQCVNTQVLDRVKQQAQQLAYGRMRKELEAMGPNGAILAKTLVLTDSQLSEDIARKNFAHWGGALQREELQRRIAAVMRLREAANNLGQALAGELLSRELQNGAIRLPVSS